MIQFDRFLFGILLGLIPLSLSSQQTLPLSLESIFSEGVFKVKPRARYHFSSGGCCFYEVEGEGIYRTSLQDTTKRKLIVAQDKLVLDSDTLPIGRFIMSKSEKQCLLLSDVSYIYRRSFQSFVYLYDLETNDLVLLDTLMLMYPSFSPDEEKVAYIKDRDIWIYDIQTRSHSKLTHGGSKNGIINGMSDWVYEEEFELTKTYEWSNDSKWIAYLRFDETDVRTKKLQYYINGYSYPSTYSYKYPKSGEDNAVPYLQVVSLEDHTQESKSIFLHDDGVTDTDIYIPHLLITPQNEICIVRMNRLQNILEVLLYKEGVTEPSIIYYEEHEHYIDLSHFYIAFLDDGKRFVISSESEGYNQLYLYHVDQGRQLKLTPAMYDIEKVLGHNKSLSTFFYSLAYPSPLDRSIFRTTIHGDVQQISKGEGWHDAQFSPKADYYIYNYSSLTDIPRQSLRHVRKESFSRLIEDNSSLDVLMQAYSYQTPQLLQMYNRHGDSLNIQVVMPPDMDSSKKYPVLLYNYGGPGSQMVRRKYNDNMWVQWMARQGYIMVTCDNRGTGYRGDVFKKQTYLQLGIMEIEDQIDIARSFAEEPYVDAKRIGHIGWSYGGFMSSLAITYGADIFTDAVAIAPVTDWRYYDNIYTERFMRKPNQNEEGYVKTSPIHYVEKMHGDFLIIHGQADDNVHPQNTYNMVEAMVQSNKQFDMRIYPDKNHVIYGGNTRLDLWRYVSNWLLEHL